MNAELSLSPASGPGSCPACGVERLRTEHGDLCMACLFAEGMDSGREQIGSYELLQRLDAGGTGIVYIAAHEEHDGLCALKLARPELLASTEALAAFRSGLRIQHALYGLPGILGARELGTHEDGRPYAVMPLLEGGTLADSAVCARYQTHDAALALIITIARAVQLAHERGVLHCDLKPENVLFSDKGEPLVSDFGLAHVLDDSELMRGASFVGGTRGFMSPEQAQQQALTTASDTFSLGVMLYWLLTRKLPFGDSDDYEHRVTEGTEAPLRELYTGPHAWELEQICARALNKRSEQRYRSAADMAADLERARDGRPIEAERKKPLRRAAKWLRRHTLVPLAAVAMCILIVYSPLIQRSVLCEVRRPISDYLRFSAAAQVGAVMNELRASAETVRSIAQDPEIRRLVDHSDRYSPPPELVNHAKGLDALSVFAPDGALRARFPRPLVQYKNNNFAFRDYFQGQLRYAQAHKRDVYVGRAFYSTGDEEPMLALITPLYEDEAYVGALSVRIGARATFGALQMRCDPQDSCMTALLGPRDRDQPDQAIPGSIYVLAAPGLVEKKATMLDDGLAETICQRLPCEPAKSDQFLKSAAEIIVIDDYKDPITQKRSTAALAAVGGTGLIVVVSTPNDALDVISEHIVDQSRRLVWVLVILGLALYAAVIAAPALTRRRLPTLRAPNA